MEELKKKVIENLFNTQIQNKRNIEVKEDTIIVLGFCEYDKNNEKNSYCVMGKYQYGQMHYSVELTDAVVLENIDDETFEPFNPFVKLDSTFIETAEFWRLPTDDEYRLYTELYPKHEIMKSLEFLISIVNDESVVGEDFDDTFEFIKERFKKC